MDDKYEDLANSIVLLAVKDYRNALVKLKIYPKSRIALNTKEEVEQFFRSNWYTCLTALDPEILICKLNEEVV